jgi:hypothetical protein
VQLVVELDDHALISVDPVAEHAMKHLTAWVQRLELMKKFGVGL